MRERTGAGKSPEPGRVYNEREFGFITVTAGTFGEGRGGHPTEPRNKNIQGNQRNPIIIKNQRC